MYTPQQIEQISFNKATFGGYNMDEVDEILGTLTEDYVTLFKENALLKSKIRVLVSKLEEYRENEASMKDAIVNAQKTCDMMVKEAEAKCTQMLSDANSIAAENAMKAEDIIAAENARVDEARRTAAAKIDELEEQLRICIQALDRIKQANRPSSPAPAPVVAEDKTEAVADEISANLEHLIGTTEDTAIKAEPRHPVSDTTTKFANLQFGRNYDPKRKNK